MTIEGKVKTKQDEIAIKCYEMMKIMYKNEYSEMIELFYGIQISKIESLESNYENTTSEPFLCLDLEIGDIKTLYGCIDKYTSKEWLDMKERIAQNGRVNQTGNNTTQSFY